MDKFVVSGYDIIPMNIEHAKSNFSSGIQSSNGSRIHKCTISLRFPGITLRDSKLEISVYTVYIVNQFQTTFARGGGGGCVCKNFSYLGSIFGGLGRKLAQAGSIYVTKRILQKRQNTLGVFSWYV